MWPREIFDGKGFAMASSKNNSIFPGKSSLITLCMVGLGFICLKALSRQQLHSLDVITGIREKIYDSAGPDVFKRTVYSLNANRTSSTSCRDLLIVCVPKTSSSAVRYVFEQLNKELCVGNLFNHFPYLGKGRHTVSYRALSNVDRETLCKKRWIISHMRYDDELRNHLCSEQRYRVGTLREPMARITSLAMYEKRRPLVLTSALTYLHVNKSMNLREKNLKNYTYSLIEKLAKDVVAEYDLIFLQEFHDESLTVLMHDLKLRIDDILVPVVNKTKSFTKEQEIARTMGEIMQDDTNRKRVDMCRPLIQFCILLIPLCSLED